MYVYVCLCVCLCLCLLSMSMSIVLLIELSIEYRFEVSSALLSDLLIDLSIEVSQVIDLYRLDGVSHTHSLSLFLSLLQTGASHLTLVAMFHAYMHMHVNCTMFYSMSAQTSSQLCAEHTHLHVHPRVYTTF